MVGFSVDILYWLIFVFFAPENMLAAQRGNFIQAPNQLDLPLLPSYPVGDEGSWHFSLFKMPFLGIPHYSYQLLQFATKNVMSFSWWLVPWLKTEAFGCTPSISKRGRWDSSNEKGTKWDPFFRWGVGKMLILGRPWGENLLWKAIIW